MKAEKKANRDRIREEKKAEKKAAREAAREAKRAAAGPGLTTREMTNGEGNVMKGINGASLRISKRKDTERGVWPLNQVVMKVAGNWSDSDKAEFRRQFGEPLDISKSVSKSEEGPNMAKILEAVVSAPTAVSAPTVNTPKLVEETKSPNAVIVCEKKAKLAEKKAKLAEKKAKFAAKKAKKAEQKRLAEVAEESVIEGDMTIESSGEEDFEEIDEDTPQPWTHDSYEGDEQLFKDEDNGVYRYDDETEDYEIIGFFHEEAEGDIPANSLVID